MDIHHNKNIIYMKISYERLGIFWASGYPTAGVSAVLMAARVANKVGLEA